MAVKQIKVSIESLPPTGETTIKRLLRLNKICIISELVEARVITRSHVLTSHSDICVHPSALRKLRNSNKHLGQILKMGHFLLRVSFSCWVIPFSKVLVFCSPFCSKSSGNISEMFACPMGLYVLYKDWLCECAWALHWRQGLII